MITTFDLVFIKTTVVYSQTFNAFPDSSVKMSPSWPTPLIWSSVPVIDQRLQLTLTLYLYYRVETHQALNVSPDSIDVPLLASYHSCTVITNFLFINRRLLLRPWDRYLYCWCSHHHWELKCTAHLTANNVIVLPIRVLCIHYNKPRTSVFDLFY